MSIHADTGTVHLHAIVFYLCAYGHLNITLFHNNYLLN